MTKKQLMDKFIELCPRQAEDSISIRPIAGGHTAVFKSKKYPLCRYIFRYESDTDWDVSFKKVSGRYSLDK